MDPAINPIRDREEELHDETLFPAYQSFMPLEELAITTDNHLARNIAMRLGKQARTLQEEGQEIDWIKIGKVKYRVSRDEKGVVYANDGKSEGERLGTTKEEVIKAIREMKAQYCRKQRGDLDF